MEIKPVVLKKVVLIESGLFIGGVLQDLIAQQSRLVVIRLEEKDIVKVLSDVSYEDPDVLIIDDLTFELHGHQFLTLLQQCAHFRIIVINSKENQGEVYSRFHFPIHQAADFFEVF